VGTSGNKLAVCVYFGNRGVCVYFGIGPKDSAVGNRKSARR